MRGSPCFFKLAVVQQTKTRDLTFEGVEDHNRPLCSNTHIWSNFGSVMPNDLKMANSNMFGALFVASGLLNLYIWRPNSEI